MKRNCVISRNNSFVQEGKYVPLSDNIVVSSLSKFIDKLILKKEEKEKEEKERERLRKDFDRPSLSSGRNVFKRP